MTRKTESLAYPADPLAAIRELHNLDAGRSDVPLVPVTERSVDTSDTVLPRPPATGSAVVNEAASTVSTVKIRAQHPLAVAVVSGVLTDQRVQRLITELAAGGVTDSLLAFTRQLIEREGMAPQFGETVNVVPLFTAGPHWPIRWSTR